jgi:hypothetical protein
MLWLAGEGTHYCLCPWKITKCNLWIVPSMSMHPKNVMAYCACESCTYWVWIFATFLRLLPVSRAWTYRLEMLGSLLQSPWNIARELKYAQLVVCESVYLFCYMFVRGTLQCATNMLLNRFGKTQRISSGRRIFMSVCVEHGHKKC